MCSTSQQGLQNHSSEARPRLPASQPSCRILPQCFKAGGRIPRCNQCLQQRRSEADTGWMWGAQGSETTGTLPSCALNGNQTGRSSNASVILPHGHLSRGKRRGVGAVGMSHQATPTQPRPRWPRTNRFQLGLVLTSLLLMFIPWKVQMCSAKTPQS